MSKVNLILIASGQNNPNLISALHYKAQGGGIDTIRIFATESIRKQGSSTKLKEVLGELNLADSIHVDEADDCDNGIYGCFQRYLETKITETEKHWIVNITGGLKTFSLDASHLLDHPRLTFIYRELGADSWVQVRRDRQGKIYYELLEDILHSEDTMASLSPVIIAKINDHNLPKEIKTAKPGESCAPGSAEGWPDANFADLSAMVEVVSKQNVQQSYIDHYKLACKPAQVKFGDALEFLVFQAARFVGLEAVWSLDPISDIEDTESEHSIGEMDVVVSSRYGVILLDVKHRAQTDDLGALNQVYEAYAKSTRIGGLRGRAILVRPLMDLGKEALSVAKKLNIEVWGPAEMNTFFSRMAQLSDTSNESIKSEAAALDDKVQSLESPWGRDRRSSAVFDYRSSLERHYNGGKAIGLSHDGRNYIKCKDGRDVDLKVIDLSAYGNREGQPRALIFPWRVEVRSPHQIGGLLQFSETKSKAGNFTYTSDLEAAQKMAQTEGKDLKQWLEEKLAGTVEPPS